MLCNKETNYKETVKREITTNQTITDTFFLKYDKRLGQIGQAFCY